MAQKIKNIGFDLDGVILYNPARIVRPIIVFVKKYFLKRDINKFYYPKNKTEQMIWNILHKSSVWPAPGIEGLLRLLKEKKIKAYIISARYESLKTDFDAWMKKIDPDHVFMDYFYNNQNEQPHLYKERMIRKLNLDIFVEDNWDIVAHINSKFKIRSPGKGNPKFKIFWIYNILDRNINYPYKFPSLKSVVDELSKI